jgi:hypothetical protein
MGKTASAPASNPAGGRTSSPPGRKSRPLSRHYGADARSKDLAGSIPAHQRAISEHEGAMLREIAEFDQAEAWRGDGALSMVEWLVARCHVSRARARKLVESAARVEELPALSAALADGRLTLDVFAPLAAVATPDTDEHLARASEHWTPKQAHQLAAEVTGTSDAQSAERFRRRFVRFDDDRCLLWAQLTEDSYALVKAAIAGRARRHDHPSASDPDYARFESRCADALLDICIERGRRSRRTGPSGKIPRPGASDTAAADPTAASVPTASTAPSEPTVSTAPTEADADEAPGHRSAQISMVVHTDLERLLYGDGYGHASIAGVGPISAEVARRLACTANITVSFDAPDGACLDQKTLVREPTEAQQIEIRRRDNGCRFPGCGCRTVTDIHHVVWASKQGPTIMSNLLTLCVAHHSRVHELGWKLDGDAQGEVRFISPQGHVVVSSPSPAWRPPRK